MHKDPFEQIRKMQEAFNKSLFPIQQMQRQFEVVNKSLLPLINQINLLENSFSPVIEIIRQQQEMNNRVIQGIINEPLRIQIQQMNELIKRMTRIPKLELPIPKIIYPEFEQLINKVQEVIPKDDHSDLTKSITVSDPKNVSIDRPAFTWGQFLSALFMVYQLLYPIYSDAQSSHQRDQIHREQIEHSERQHNEKMEQDERQHRERLDQDERQHQDEYDQKKRHQEELMIELANFVDLVTPHIPSDQEIYESPE